MLSVYGRDPQDKDGKKYWEFAKLFQENGLGEGIGYDKVFTKAYGEYTSAAVALKKAQDDAKAYFGAPEKSGDEAEVFDSASASLQQLMDKLPSVSRNLKH
jgi:hypothetical protein